MPLEITQRPSDGLALVKGYGEGGFRIGPGRHHGSVLIVNGTVYAIPVDDVAQLTQVHLEPVLTANPAIELLLIGTGAKLLLPPKEIHNICQDVGVSMDPMDTGAAARTYNVLLLEARRVSALLLSPL